MLQRLTINNYALIDALDIEFPEHLVIITGETGAGKSILLGALSLVLGAKADVGVIKDKTRNCVVEAEFDSAIVRRVITPAGRSRIFIDDEPATLEDVKALSSSLIDIHSQNSQTLLSDEKFQMRVLDAFAGNARLLDQYAEAYEAHAEAVRGLTAIDGAIERQAKDHDYIEFQWRQLSEAQLKDGELALLEAEQQQLANAETIQSALQQVCYLLEEGENSILSQLKEGIQTMERTSAYIADLEQYASRAASCRIELKDIAADIAAKCGQIVADPLRLQVVEERIALIYNLLHKHNCENEHELIELREHYALQLVDELDFRQKRTQAAALVEKADKLCSALAAELHTRRSTKAVELSQQLQSAVRNLEIPHAVVETRVAELETRGKNGADSVKFYFSANGATGIKELSKCASGGEISRIMLCIKALLAKYVQMPTVIFDEIDTGVSGSVADKMGQMIVEMGSRMQVVAITHLPQVASKGNAHFLVYKTFGEDTAVSNIRPISGEERIREIARMLSGSHLTPEALANAKVLLDFEKDQNQ